MVRFHLIDRIDEFEPARRVRGRKVTSHSEEFWEDAGDGPVMPAPLTLEALCQVLTRILGHRPQHDRGSAHTGDRGLYEIDLRCLERPQHRCTEFTAQRPLVDEEAAPLRGQRRHRLAGVVQAGAGRRGQFLQGGDPQLPVQGGGLLRPEAGEGQQAGHRPRRLLLQLREHRQPAGFDDLGDLAGQVPADTGERREVLPFLEQHRHALRQVADGAGGVAVGPDAEGVLAADVEQVGDLGEDLDDVGVVDGHISPKPGAGPKFLNP